MSNPTEYLSIADARQRLEGRGVRVTRETVRRWAKTGKVRSKRLRSGGQFLVCTEDLDAMLIDSTPAGAA